MHTHLCVCTGIHKQRAGWINQGPQPIALMQQEAWCKLGQLGPTPTEYSSGAQFHWLSKDYCSVAQRLLWLEQNTHYCDWYQSHEGISKDPDSSKGAQMPSEAGQQWNRKQLRSQGDPLPFRVEFFPPPVPLWPHLIWGYLVSVPNNRLATPEG